MKFNVNAKFWKETNFLAKWCFYLGAFFMDLGMKLSGLEGNKD